MIEKRIMTDIRGQAKRRQPWTFLSVIGSLRPKRTPPSIVVLIQSLDDPSIEVARDISVVVQYEDEAYVASFFDANINASGESQLEAVEELKLTITSLFHLYTSKESILGDEPKRQLAVLREFVRAR